MSEDVPPDRIRLAINTLKMLAVDAVEQARSGHPGLPMGAADCAFWLWTRHLRFDPAAPDWPDRDRFVLSAGHGSMLLYALLHLSGYALPIDELKRFRQWGSMTPGHPERGCAPGVETTTGPLGQGAGNAVGMALAAKMLAERFNTPDERIVGHRVWALVSDGDMMEGIGSEAASIAGHLGLGNLTFVYDDNHITIEGDTALAFSEDVGRRFEAYGWRVWRIDGHDHPRIEAALTEAERETERPGLIVARTHIANGSPNRHDSAKAHGEPLGPEETAATKKNLGWPLEPRFLVPEEGRAPYAARAREGARLRADWERRFQGWSKAHPERRLLWDRMHAPDLPGDLLERLLAALPDLAKPQATRALASLVQQRASEIVPGLAGGSADLEPSTRTAIRSSPSIARKAFAGRNFHFGVREHGMGAILNGLALHGGLVPYGSTFLIFSDYMRPPMRLAAMMRLGVIYVFTHDSIFLGEDGPTHQPIEQLAGLRAVPNLLVIRPADGPETAAAWALALRRREAPTALVLTRQEVPPLPRPPGFDRELLLRGGYVLSDPPAGAIPQVILIATGSEVAAALEARSILEEKKIPARLVSMPAPDLFLQQPEAYRRTVLPEGPKRAVVEAARLHGWERVAGGEALLLGLDHYGASAPHTVLAEKFGFAGRPIAERVEVFLRGA
jgi:transketolase